MDIKPLAAHFGPAVARMRSLLLPAGLSLLLVACNNGNNSAGSVTTLDDDTGQITLELFDGAKAIRNLNPDNLFALITVDGTETRYQQGDTINLSFPIQNGDEFNLKVEWYEEFAGIDLLLGRYTFSDIITSNTNIEIRSSDYTTSGADFDFDSDGLSNLAERLQDSDPLVRDEPPANESFVSVSLAPVAPSSSRNVFALLRVNDQEIRLNQNFTITDVYTVQNNVEFTLEVEWFERFANTDLLLARYNFTQVISQNVTIEARESDYTTQGETGGEFDIDGDAQSNLQER